MKGTTLGEAQEFLHAALNEREEAHQAFRQWLAAKDLETTHWILGELGIRTVSSLVNLTEKQFEDTLDLFPPKRPGEPGDVEAACAYVLDSQGLQRTKELATFHAQAAVDACCSLPASAERDGLIRLCHVVLSRSS